MERVGPVDTCSSSKDAQSRNPMPPVESCPFLMFSSVERVPFHEAPLPGLGVNLIHTIHCQIGSERKSGGVNGTASCSVKDPLRSRNGGLLAVDDPIRQIVSTYGYALLLERTWQIVLPWP